MSEHPTNQLTDRERIARLERFVYWHNVGWIILVIAFIAYLIPPIRMVLGFPLIPLIIGGAVIAFIRLVMILLDHFFASPSPGE